MLRSSSDKQRTRNSAMRCFAALVAEFEKKYPGDLAFSKEGDAWWTKAYHRCGKARNPKTCKGESADLESKLKPLLETPPNQRWVNGPSTCHGYVWFYRRKADARGALSRPDRHLRQSGPVGVARRTHRTRTGRRRRFPSNPPMRKAGRRRRGHGHGENRPRLAHQPSLRHARVRHPHEARIDPSQRHRHRGRMGQSEAGRRPRRFRPGLYGRSPLHALAESRFECASQASANSFANSATRPATNTAACDRHQRRCRCRWKSKRSNLG